MEIRPVHGWEMVGQSAPLGSPPLLGPGGGAPWREADGEAEDGGGAATSARGEDAVEAGG
jgi:hypothetical protein